MPNAFRRWLFVVSVLSPLFILSIWYAAHARTIKTPVDPKLFNGLRYRSIGPARGGRVTAVAGVRKQPHTFYMGATGGGVWKTTDAGDSWYATFTGPNFSLRPARDARVEIF